MSKSGLVQVGNFAPSHVHPQTRIYLCHEGPDDPSGELVSLPLASHDSGGTNHIVSEYFDVTNMVQLWYSVDLNCGQLSVTNGSETHDFESFSSSSSYCS